MLSESVTYEREDILAANDLLAQVLEGRAGAQALLQACAVLVPSVAGFCVVNRRNAPPVLLCDTYPEGAPKQAVQTYVTQTYLLNPVYNAYLAGLSQGVHRMADLAPDNWQRLGAFEDPEEEVGYRTPGWPRHLEELSVTVNLPEGEMGEISLARPAADGGYTPEHVARLVSFVALFAAAFRILWHDHPKTEDRLQPQGLGAFAADILSPREAEIVQLILQGHSSLSIGLRLGIALPTVKTHRRNAYQRLGISTQQQLFNAFLRWQGRDRDLR